MFLNEFKKYLGIEIYEVVQQWQALLVTLESSASEANLTWFQILNSSNWETILQTILQSAKIHIQMKCRCAFQSKSECPKVWAH